MFAFSDVRQLVLRARATGGDVEFDNASRPLSDFSSNTNSFSKEVIVAAPRSRVPKLAQRTRFLGSEVLSSWEQLNSIVRGKEFLLRKRWLKKSKRARSEILRCAWPSQMPSTHRPDFAILNDPTTAKSNSVSHVNSFKHPHLNHEDLVQARPLLMLLNSRGRKHPATFALADRQSVQVGVANGVIPRLIIDEYVVVLSSSPAMGTYGSVVPYEKKDTERQPPSSRIRFLMGDALLILEVQEATIGFLIKCCLRLLSDIPASTLLSLELPIQPEPPALTSADISYKQQAILDAEAPFRQPVGFDFRRIKAVVGAELSAAEDHIWALREDPAYFSALLTKMYHVVNNKFACSPQDHVGKSPYQIALNSVSDTSAVDLVMWKTLLDRIHDVQTAVYQIIPEQVYVKEVYTQCVYLKSFVNHNLVGAFGDFKEYLVQTPELHPHLTVRPGSRDGTVPWSIQVKSTHQTGSLLHLLGVILDDATRWRHGTLNVIHELQCLIDRDRTERNKLSSLAIAKISEMAIWAEVAHQIKNICPSPIDLDDAAPVTCPLSARPEALATAIISSSRPPSLFSLPSGYFLQENLFYPVHEARTESNIDALRKAEAHLDQFWKVIDEAIPYDHGLIGVLIEYGVQIRKINRTPVFDASKRTQTHNADPAAEDFDHAFPNLSIGPASTIGEPRRFVPVESRQKVKTRPEPQEVEQIATDTQGGDSDQTIGQPKVLYVSKRALKVFRTLFHTPSADHQPSQSGEIPWSDFLNAMTSVGFEVEKLHGSAWRFMPRGDNVTNQHAIHFHEPHPSSKISFSVARGIGRRLTKHYDWYGDLFQLRSNGASRNNEVDNMG